MDDGYYDAIAPSYDALHGEEQDRKLAAFLGRVSLRGALLDVGCGTGRSAMSFEDLEWHGIEPSAGLIAQAAPDVRGRILRGVAEELPFPDASFDAVLCLTVLQNVRDAGRALDEMRRVCKPGGALLLSFLKGAKDADAMDARVRSSWRVRESWVERHDRMYVCEKEM